MLKLMMFFLSFSLSAKAKDINVEKIFGVYKYRTEIQNKSDKKKFGPENILEIVRYKDHAVYFNARLHFDDLTVCKIHGIAEVEGSKIHYRSDRCEMLIHFAHDKIYLEDKGGCKAKTCGANGWYAMEMFKPSQRKNLKNAKKMMESPEYQYAVQEYKEHKAKLSSKSDEASSPQK